MARNNRKSKVTTKVIGYCEKHGVSTFKRSAKWNKKYNKFYYREECILCSNAYSRDRARDRKLKAIAYKGGICSSCGGEFDPCIYDFHHTDPTTKEGKPSELLSRSWPTALKELDKCILLCANCHRLAHKADHNNV